MSGSSSRIHSGFAGTSLRKGTVVAAYPALNTYDVQPEFGNPRSETITCTAFTGATTAIGVAGSGLYMPGTMVYYTYDRAPVNTELAKRPLMHTIIGPVPLAPITTNASQYPLYNLYNTTGVDYLSEQVTNAILNTRKMPLASTDMSYGLPMDTLAGDFVKAGSFGSYMSLSSSYAGIGGSRGSRLEFFSFRQLARLSTESFEMNSPVSEVGFRPDWSDSWLFYDRKAGLAREGLGMQAGASSAFAQGKHKVDTFIPSETSQQGIFRKETYFGNAVDGGWEFMELPEPSGKNSVRTWEEVDNPPFGVMSRRTGFDGSDSYRSFKGFSFVKSSYIPLVRELAPENKKPTSSSVETKQWADDSVNAETVKYYHHLASTVERYETDYNTANYYNTLLRSRPANWKIFSRKEIESKYSIDSSDYSSLPVLGETYMEYDKPKEFTGNDEARKTKYKAALLESMIKMLDDGTIVIGDGFGSEIRLARGTITITCPGDLKILPGRDTIEMTPRNRIMNAGKNLFAQAANGSVYLKAEENMTMLSGNKETGGITLIENRSTSGMVNGKWLVAADSSDKPTNNGVLIKSINSLGVVAQDMYIGIYDKTDKSDKGMDRSKSGNIIIDSAGGLLGLMGTTGYGKFRRSVMLASGEGSSVSLMSLNASMVGLYTAGTLGIVSTGVNMVGGTGTVNVPELTKSGVVDNNVQLGGGNTSLNIQGNIRATLNMICMGMINAGSVNAGTGAFGNGGQDYWGGGGRAPDGMHLNPINGSAFGYAGLALKGISPSNNALYTGKCMNNTGFYYPDKNVFKTDYFELVAAKWQHLMGSNGFQWNEPAVTSPDGSTTRTYPGNTKWNEEVFVKLDSDGILRNKSKLMAKYTINCTQSY